MINEFELRLLSNYKDIITVNLSFLGTVIAIFFSLVSLPIQNILGQYSQDLVNKLKDDKYFKWSLVIFILVFLYNLFLLVVKVHFSSIIISLFFSVLSLLVFWLLIKRIYELLDVRNQIKQIAEDIIKEMPSKIIESERVEGNNVVEEVMSLISPPEIVSIAKVPKCFVDWMILKTTLIIDVVQKSIKKDSYEIVEAGFKDVLGISKEYIKIRKKYSDMEDEFLDYIVIKLRDSNMLVSDYSHPKIMETIVHITGNIAREILNIKTFTRKFGQNYMPNDFLFLLREVILSKYNLRMSSSAAYDACDQYIQVVIQSIEEGYPTSGGAYIDILGNMSNQTMDSGLLGSDSLSEKINESLVFLLNYILNNLSKIEKSIDRQVLLSILFAKINKIVLNYLKKYGEILFNSSIDPFIKVYPGLNLSMVLGAFFRNGKMKKEFYDEVIGELLRFLKDFYGSIELIQKTGKKEILDIAVSISFVLIRKVVILEGEAKTKTLEILREYAFRLIYMPMDQSKTEEREQFMFDNQIIERYSMVLGLMIMENKDDLFTNIIQRWTEQFIIMTDKKKGIFYQYLKIIGSWIYKFEGSSDLLEKIKKSLSDYKEEELLFFAFADKERWLYSLLTASTIDASYGDKVNRDLFDPKDVKNFEEFLAK